MIPQTFTVTSSVSVFLHFSFSVLQFLVVGSVRLTHVGLRAHVKIASRIVSCRIVIDRQRQGDSSGRGDRRFASCHSLSVW